MGSSVRRLLLAAALLLALVAAQAALAESPVTRFTLADQAAAKAVVLKAADLGTGWKGGLSKPTVDGPPACAGWNPKQSDLVITGAAESQFTAQGLMAFSGVQLYKTTRMIALDWQRTVVHPRMPNCLARDFAADAGEGVRVVSMKRLPFAKIAPYAARFRLLLEYTEGETVRVFFDIVLVGRGRTAISLGFMAPYAGRAEVEVAELRLAKLLLARIKV